MIKLAHWRAALYKDWRWSIVESIIRLIAYTTIDIGLV
jgi:hypothetical protein